MPPLKSAFPIQTPRLAELGLAPVACIVALGCGLIALAALPLPAVEVPPQPPQRWQTEALPPLPPPAAATAALARPIFAPARRPAGNVATVGAVAASADPKTFILEGVARARGYASALVKTSDGKVRTIRIGGEIMGWRLAGVGPDHVRLARDGEVVRLNVGGPAQ